MRIAGFIFVILAGVALGLGSIIASGALFLLAILFWFGGMLSKINRDAQKRHRELMGLLEQQHRESMNFIIGELRRIFPPASPPPNVPTIPPPPDPGIQKLPRKNP